MKRIICFFLFTIIALFLPGCKNNDQNLIQSQENSQSLEEQQIDYDIEQVILSKGYQSIEPKVEVLKKGNHIKLLASLGLVNSSGVYVDKITRKGNEVNIYVHSLSKDEDIKIVVPQIIIDMKGSKLKDLDNIKFNIVNENYKPIDVKFGVNELINKIKSEFKIATDSIPTIDISSIDDKIYWNIAYSSIFDKTNYETPIINLSVQIDANTGEIIKSTKSFLSSLIDEGQVLDYSTGSYILYKKPEVDIDRNADIETLWIFDIKDNSKTMIFSSKYRISAATFSPNLENISLVESNNENTELFIIPLNDIRAYKVSFEAPIKPRIIRWKDNDNLYIVENVEDNSNIYNYNLIDNSTVLISKVNKNIVGLKILNDSFLIVEGDDNKINLKISLTNDWKEFKLKDYGFNPDFVDENKISYLEKKEKEDKNILHIYDEAKETI